MTKLERFKKAFDYLRYCGEIHTQKDLAIKMNAAPPNVSGALKGDPKILTDRFLLRFNSAFNDIFNNKWLLTGEGSMLQSSPPASEPRIVATDEESYEAAKQQGVEMIPEYDVEFHGGDGIISLSEPIIAMWSVPGVPTDTYIIQIKGDSMAPLLKSGTRVAVRPRSLVSSALELPFGEIYAVAVYDEDGNNHTHIKYLRRHPDPAKENTHWIARSVNREEYDDFEIPIARVHLLGRVIMSVNFL